MAVTTCEPRALGDFEAWFDVVAVDAPCSGEGMFRKDPDARGEWSEGNVKQCAARQDEILREAWRALKPGGTLVYSTCTFNRDEDEGALERMAAWAGDEIAESEETAVEDAWGIVCGRVGAFRTFRFYPHRTCGEGFFAAVARKSFDAGGRVRAPKARRTVFAAVDRKTAGELARWVRNPGGMRFAAVADTCYAWHAAQADAFTRLALRQSEWFVSDDDRFSMQALADILRKAQQRGVLTVDDLYLDEPHVISLLLSDPIIAAHWQEYRCIVGTQSGPNPPEGVYAVRIAAKKRSIDPLVQAENGLRRFTAISTDYAARLCTFRADDFDRWVWARFK